MRLLTMNPCLRFKQHLSHKIADVVKKHREVSPLAVSKLLTFGSEDKNGETYLKCSYNSLQKLYPELSEEGFSSLLNISRDDVIRHVDTILDKNKVPNTIFYIDQNKFCEDVLLNRTSSDFEPRCQKENLVMEYSSPNIAKPFHMGHMRSTIIGNFLANLYEYLGHNVTRLTYLGDWGTQFGVLQIGIHQMNMSIAELKSEPMRQLYNAYVVGNRLVEEDKEAAAEARSIFSRLESGNCSQIMERWKLIRTATVSELARTYARLGVSFDDYHWESTYNAQVFAPIIKVMEENSLIEDDDGKKVMVLDGGKRVPLLKSDGSTLYLSRDVAAALDRWVTFRFDRMQYVVDNSQNQHFSALSQVLRRLEYDWADSVEQVKFGRIQGMSTRRGQVVFLADILDEAQLRMAEKQYKTASTKDFSAEVSDVLGVSAIIVNDLKQRRMRDYSFDWDTALQSDGDSGVKLQYTHCRLISLEQNCGVALPDNCDPSLLTEPEALDLVLEIARMEDAVERAYSKLEAFEIVNYLFRLSNKISRALKTLNVKNQSTDLAEQRLLLFHRARTTLHNGMKLLGLRPLNQM